MFYKILFCLHSAFYTEASQPVCKPNQITGFLCNPGDTENIKLREILSGNWFSKKQNESTRKPSSKGVKINVFFKKKKKKHYVDGLHL